MLVYVPWFIRSNGRSADVLQAVCGIAYRRGFFSNVTQLADIPTDCFTTDDTWISGYLATIPKVRRLLTPGSWFAHWTLEPVQTKFVKKDHEHRLATINTNVSERLVAIVHFNDLVLVLIALPL